MFTAHPTEAVRRALLEKESEVVRCLVEDIDRALTPQERRADVERMRRALTAAWQTDETPPQKPTVADEFEHVAFYLADVLYRVLPVFHEALEDALRDVWGPRERDRVHSHPATGVASSTGVASAPDVNEPDPVLTFGSWVGGDMDGNPNVGAATIAATLAGQRAMVLGNYRGELARLGEALSQSTSRVEVSPALVARSDALQRELPDATDALKARHAEMPYRRLCALLAAKLAATADDAPAGYADAAAFVDDLRLVEASLRAHRGEHAGLFAVRRLRRRAQAFGFHLATLDLRQESSRHDAALAALRLMLTMYGPNARGP